jgi:HAD superfamily hydrolase (TIGR01549 family)
LTYKGVLIDFGDTVAYVDEVEFREYEKALAVALKKYGYKRRLKDIASALASIYMESTKGKLKTSQEFWNLMLAKLKISERSELPDTLQDIRNNHEMMMWKLYDKVPATLSVLHKKYKMALVSNCSVGTDKLISSLGLAGFFDCIVLSYQIGVRKPDKRMYLEALTCLGLEANECVFIADEISDLEGARENELKTILVRQGSSTFQDARDVNFKPDFQINHISEVTRIL